MAGETAAGLARRLAGMWRVWTGAAGIVIMVLWSGGACTQKVRPGKVEAAAGLPLPPDARLTTVAQESVAPRIDVVGTVTSRERVHLGTRIAACVKAVHASAGDAVKQGQVLVALDDREIREQIAAGEAQLRQAETDYGRMQRLFESKAATEQALVAAESAFNAARANVERMRVTLSYASIVSPIDGVVTERRIEAGDLAGPGQVLLSVYNPASMQIEADVPVRLIPRLALGRDVEVALDYPPGVRRGRVGEMVSEIDPASRTRKVKVHMDTAGRDVLPGTFGRVWVEEEPRPAMLIPAACVYRVGQLDLVQVAEGGQALRRLVRRGPAHGERVEVLSGLSAGEQVLLAPIREN